MQEEVEGRAAWRWGKSRGVDEDGTEGGVCMHDMQYGYDCTTMDYPRTKDGAHQTLLWPALPPTLESLPSHPRTDRGAAPSEYGPVASRLVERVLQLILDVVRVHRHDQPEGGGALHLCTARDHYLWDSTEIYFP